MTRTVYIYENNDLRIGLDGPAVLIERSNKAAQRIPFYIISKIYLVGSVNVTTELLIALADENIPVIVIKQNGEKKAILLPFNDKLPKFHRLQRIILEDYEKLNKYLDWVETYRHYFQLVVLRRVYSHFAKVNSIGEGDYKIYIKRLMPDDRDVWNIVSRPIGSFLLGLIYEHLIKAKLDVHIGGYFRRLNFGCLLDFFYILEPLQDEEAIMFFKQKDYFQYFDNDKEKLKLNNLGHRNITNRFENKRQQIETYIDKVIDDYFALLREFSS